ncbi:MAG: dihydroorotate dehydrogenase-like protein, partial [candidate division KSB1 bacterium]|nr:dihydroorotate dehydrogenase-like protein [candidate division KSB1 bacterium]
MIDLSTSYLGLQLRNPLIVASSGLTKSAAKIADCEKFGAGAVVVKSIFEEVLAQKDFQIDASAALHTEAYDYLRAQLELQYGPQEYCEMLSEAKRLVSIPVIASVNCVTAKWWISYARQLQEAGADALELNIFKTAIDKKEDAATIEKMYLDILREVTKQVSIPVAVKIGPYFSSLPHFVSRLTDSGALGVVIFNRFTEPDIDIDRLTLTTTFSFSSSYDLFKTLRWTAVLYGQVGCDISAVTGIKSGADVIKLILAGAQTVQIASLFYQQGLDRLRDLLDEVSVWMKAHGFAKLS